jgi:hypothetical protein
MPSRQLEQRISDSWSISDSRSIPDSIFDGWWISDSWSISDSRSIPDSIFDGYRASPTAWAYLIAGRQLEHLQQLGVSDSLSICDSWSTFYSISDS